MQIVSSYGVEIKKQKNIPLCSTLDIFRKAVSYLIPVYAETWKELSEIRNSQKRFNEAEHLVHETKKNHARFPFDRHFPKMPSYLRRAAIQHALGAVSSYQTRLSLWEKGELKGKPKLVCENHAMPVFYRDVMYKEAEPGEDAAHLKLFDGREWKWFQVKLLHTDMEYLRKKWSGKKASAPTLERKHHKYFLRFSYTEEVSLSKTDVKEQVICSVDLGINTDAVCSIMRADGTILGRKFINFSSDKDHLYHVLGRIRRFQRRTFLQTGPKPMGLCKKTEHGTVPQNRCGDHEICCRVSGRCNCVRISGNAGEKYPEKRNKSFTYGESGIFRNCVNIRHIGMGFVCPGSVPGTPAGWPVTEAEW